MAVEGPGALVPNVEKSSDQFIMPKGPFIYDFHKTDKNSEPPPPLPPPHFRLHVLQWTSIKLRRTLLFILRYYNKACCLLAFLYKYSIPYPQNLPFLYNTGTFRFSKSSIHNPELRLKNKPAKYWTHYDSKIHSQ